MKRLIASFVLCFPLLSFAHPYYGENFLQTVMSYDSDFVAYDKSDYEGDSQSNHAIKQFLHTILKSSHVRRDGQPDIIQNHCQRNDGDCYQQVSYSYKEARKYLFGQIHLQSDNKRYKVRCFYCLRDFTNRDFGRDSGLGPMRYPDHNVMNTEHVWPQSKFTNRYPTGMQKTDLHHLLPSGNKINGMRGNFPFGEVYSEGRTDCSGTALGSPRDFSSKRLHFQPPVESRGDVARAMFYFSIRYEMEIDAIQEFYLKKWHEEDPVDENERKKNEEIYKIQSNRNPFIDYPELVKVISDF